MKRFVAVLLVFAWCVFIGGCATGPIAEQEPPPPQAVYNFNFSPPEKTAKKLGITIGIVAPQRDNKISFHNEQGKIPLLDAGINPDPNELLRYPSMTAHTGPIPAELNEMGVAFTKAASHDYEGIILARDFDTMGRFKSIEDMTYPQKMACNLIIVPEFSQVIRSRPSTVMVDLIEGTAAIRTEIVLNAYEPLSKEKLWSKRFTNESKPFSYKVKYRKRYIYDAKGNNRIGVRRMGISWDNRANGFAEGFTGLFRDLMNKSWAYFSPEEMTVLKKHSDDIREKKRFWTTLEEAGVRSSVSVRIDPGETRPGIGGIHAQKGECRDEEKGKLPTGAREWWALPQWEHFCSGSGRNTNHRHVLQNLPLLNNETMIDRV